MKYFIGFFGLMLSLSLLFTACGDGDGISGSAESLGSNGFSGDTVITISAIPGVAVPVRGEDPVTTAIDTPQYTGTVAWFPDDNPFADSTVYTANIVITAKAGYTLTGVAADFFTVAGAATVTHSEDSGTLSAVFPETGTGSDIDIAFLSAAQIGGVSGITDSTGLTLTFDADPATLTADNITVTGATKGILSGMGITRTLGISSISAANGGAVSVTITSPAGYAISGSPQTAVVYREINWIDLSNWTVEQQNSSISYTIPSSTQIPKGGFLIISRNSSKTDFETFWSVTLGPDVVFLNSGGTFPSINGSEIYTLLDSAAGIIDGPTIQMDAAGSQNLQRILYDNAGSEASWTRSSAGSSTPGTTSLGNSSTLGVFIIEIADAVGFGAYIYEFIELHFPEPEN